MEHLHKIAEALLERETVSGDDIDLLMKGEPLPPPTEEGSVRRAAKAYEDMSRKFGDTPPVEGATATAVEGAPTEPEGEFKLEEVPPTPPKKPYKPDQDNE